MMHFRLAARSREDGSSLLELMIAMAVLAFGVLACMGMMVYSIGGNSRSRLQSGSTVVAQMLLEKIMSVPVDTSPTLNITDCAGNSISINTAGSSAASGTGATLNTTTGDVSYSSSAPSGYSALFTDCGTSGRKTVYDIRWNIKTPTTYTKLVTVSARMQGGGTTVIYYSPIVTLRSIIGQGS